MGGLAFAPLALARGGSDGIIAVVNDEAVTLKDLREYVAGIYAQLRVENKSKSEIQEIMATYEEKGVAQLIEDRLILSAATEKELEIRPEAIAKRLKEIQSKYPSEEDFIKALTAQGMTVTDLKTKLTNQMKAKYMVDIEIRQKIFVNPQDVTKYYNDHHNDFERKPKYNLQSIFVSFDKGKQEARNRAGEARAKLIAGEDFDKIFKEYSQMPSVGTIEKGQMVPAIEDEVFNLKLGDVSDLVEVDTGIYVFKVVGISPGHIETLQEAKDKVYNILYDQQFKDKFKQWIDKLRKKAYVEIRD